MPARRYSTPEEARAAKLEQNRRWKADNLEAARTSCADWHAREKAAGRKPSLDSRVNPAFLMLSKAKQRARKAGVPYELDRAWILEALKPMECSVTGLPLTFEPGHGFRTNPWCPSIDRVKPSLGYTKANSRIVCWAYNLAKSEWGDDVPLLLATALMRTI